MRRQQGNGRGSCAAARLGRRPARQHRRHVGAVGPAVVGARSQPVDFVERPVGRGQIDRVFGLIDGAGTVPDEGDGVPQSGGMDRPGPAPAATAFRRITAHHPLFGALGALSARVPLRRAGRRQAAVRGGTDIDQQGPVAVEDETGQRVAVFVQAVVGQAVDHRHRRLGPRRIEGEDPAHLGQVDPAVRAARERVRHRQAAHQPDPRHSTVRIRRHPPERAPARVP